MGRKRKPDKKKVQTLGASVAPSFEDAIVSLAAKKERTKAWLSGRLLLRGFIAFVADGQWTSTEIEDEAISKGLRPEQLEIVKAQLKVGLESAIQDQPIPTEPTPSAGEFPDRMIGRAYIPNKKKGGY